MQVTLIPSFVFLADYVFWKNCKMNGHFIVALASDMLKQS